ncbi:hypothetical protein [Paenibacillus sp. MMS18-CY102]|uniref:hypothetical protein n=1 Tax=Paenibacillus sp. MMS18-CY102 TaxID=2682849 RepID=UPI001366082F|nr:hypothetical protein [Paenibacillus sp. MMS18-CY102]MWC29817.1 hypothetical protein [Paenibacillus sp. MMS18-CY102]
MHFKKIVSFLLSIALILSFASTGYSQASVSTVSIETARLAAADHVLTEAILDEQSKWFGKRVAIDQGQEVYDASGAIVAYSFNVEAGGVKSGELLVSAFIDNEPINFWADEGSDTITENQTINQALQKKQKEDNKKVKDKKIVWLGGLEFAYKTKFDDGSEIVYDQRGNHIKDWKQQTNADSNHPSSVNKNNRNNWDRIKKLAVLDGTGSPGQSNPSDGFTNIDPATWESGYGSIHKNYINTIVNAKQYTWVSGGVTQYSGCTPTAGKNIIQYFKDAGYSNLLKNPSTGATYTEKQVIELLRTYMGTTQTSTGTGSTLDSNVASGFEQYAQAHGYPNADFVTEATDFYTATTLIDNSKIFEILVHGNSYVGDHALTVVGYKEFVNASNYLNSKYYVVRNNWSSDAYKDYYLKSAAWTSSKMSYVNHF